MSLRSKKFSLSASSALAALFCITAVPAALAAPSAGPVGLSSDGTTLLELADDAATGTSSYRLTDAASGSYVTIAVPAGGSLLDPNALSADGSTVVGSYSDSNTGFSTAFYWTADGGIVDLGSVGGRSTYAEAVSADGSAIAGWGSITDHTAEAFYWTKSNGMQLLGYLSGGDTSEADAISADGSTVAGTATDASHIYHAFVWTVGSSAIQNIDTLNYSQSEATLISNDGSVVAGRADNYTNVFRWTSAGGMVDIGNLGTASTSLAAMSSDGGVLVGSSETVDGDIHAYRYVASTSTMGDLGTLGGTYSKASDVNADGSVVVGTASDAVTSRHGFRWTEATGMETVEQWLAGEGISLGAVTTQSADFVSANGNVVVGTTSDDTTYIARVATAGDSSSGGTGIIDTSEYLPTVAAANNVAVQNGVYGADTIMFGAQGAPMRNLLAVGQKSVWGTIDGGYDNSNAADGGLALGEFGFGYGIADGITARFSAGGTYTDQDLDAGGDVRQKGFYLSPEVSADLGRNVYLTLGGYWGRSSIDSHRGYLNGADQDYSDGSTNADTWGGKIRVDWLNATTIANTAVTPYAGLSYAHTKVDAFTESDGSFPVSYDETNDHATIARLGSDFVHPLTDKVRLLAKAEADYQFEDRSASTRGTIVGISDFDLTGEDLKQFWLRGGVGAEADVGKGTASVMINATTRGQDPDFWVRTNFTIKF